MFVQEMQSALRHLVQRPGLSMLTVGVLGAGLACVIFMLVLVNSFVLRPLPFPDPQRLMQVGVAEVQEGGDDVDGLSGEDMIALRAQLDGIAEVAGFGQETTNLSDLDRPERLKGAGVTANLWRVLGVVPQLGRDFAAADEQPGAARVVAISDALWRHRYGADAAIVGRVIRVNAEPATVVAVMPPNFSYPFNEALWKVDALTGSRETFTTITRRSNGHTEVEVQAAVAGWFAASAAREPQRFEALRAVLRPLDELTTNRITRGVLSLMLGAVVLVLLVACANCANLLLTATLARRQELAVRVALGASRGRLVVHLLAQSVTLSAIALAMAVPLAMAAAAWQEASFRMADDEGPPLWLTLDVDGTVIALAGAMAAVTAVLTGLLPALRAAGAAPIDALRDGGRGLASGAFARVSRWLVVGEVALSCLLLVSVGTLVQGIRTLDRIDLGIHSDNLLTARLALLSTAHPTGVEQMALYERLLVALRADAGVDEATLATVLPARISRQREVLPEGAVAEGAAAPRVAYGAVDDAFLDAYGVRLRAGRFFDGRDGAEGERVAVVDARFVERQGGTGEVIGRRFRLDPRDPSAPQVTVVGVIDTLTLNGPADTPQPTMLVPLRQEPARIVSVAVRTHGEASAFAPRLAEIMRTIDADTPLYWVRDYATLMRNVTYGERTVARLFTTFGLIALLLAATGLYGVMAASVGQRVREIGVRRALGAPAITVLRALFGRSLVQLGAGLALGLILGVPFAGMLTGWLTAIPTGGPAIVPMTLGVLVLAALVAIAVPAWRALRVEPMEALRHE